MSWRQNLSVAGWQSSFLISLQEILLEVNGQPKLTLAGGHWQRVLIVSIYFGCYRAGGMARCAAEKGGKRDLASAGCQRVRTLRIGVMRRLAGMLEARPRVEGPNDGHVPVAPLKATRNLIMSSRMILVFSAVLVVVLTFCMGSFGLSQKTRGETASMSSNESRWRRSLIETTSVKCVPLSDAGSYVKVNEAWFENVYEKHDSIPLRRRIVGVRLCVQFTEGMIGDGMWGDYGGPGKITGKQRVSSGGITVFVFEGKDRLSFDLPGEFSIFERMDRPRIARLEIATASRADAK